MDRWWGIRSVCDTVAGFEEKKKRELNIDMELVISILILFILVNCLLKLSFWKGWQAALFGLICGIFITATYPVAILQSKTQLADYLQNTVALQNDHYARGCRLFCVLCGCIAGMVRPTGKVVGEVFEMVSDPAYFSRPVLFTDRADL